MAAHRFSTPAFIVVDIVAVVVVVVVVVLGWVVGSVTTLAASTRTYITQKTM